MKFAALSIALLFAVPFEAAYAQSAAELDALDFEQLLNVDVITVSSRKPLTRKQVPGNVTVFNETELANTGARNLIDVLRLVPGLEFGMDVQNAVGLGVRGNWAQEGKALIVIDGMPMNEILYASPGQIFDMPVSQIRQLEVIRGPGASFYGGYAELAVISIKTKATEGFTGVEAGFNGGLLNAGMGNASAGIMTGWQGSNGAYAAVSLYGGSFVRGEGLYTDTEGSTADVYEGNRNRPVNLHTHFGYKGLKGQLFFRDDRGTYQEAWTALPEPLAISHRRIMGQLTYDWEINRKWTVTPKISYTFHQPWTTDSTLADTEEDSYYTTRASRLLTSVLVSGELSRKWNTLTGAEVFVDRGFNATNDFLFGPDQDQASVRYTNIAVFSQQNIETPWAVFNAGLRYDYNDSFGSALNPWAGANREFGKWNAKFLFGYTFRAPSIENVRLRSGGIQPERTRLFEAEIGYQLNANTFVSLTAFDQKLNRVIVYAIGENEEESYTNFGNTGSRGLETEIRYSHARLGYLNLSHSFYTAAHSQVPTYAVPGRTDRYLGFARHKTVLAGSWKAAPNLTVNPTATFLSERSGLVYGDAATDPAFPLKTQTFDPEWLVNLSVRRHDVVKGVDLSLTIMDLLNSRFDYIQPYESYASPLPGTGREVLLSAVWKFR